MTAEASTGRQLSVAVVGANHPNKDGGNRRSEIAFCNPGEPLELRPEPKNEFDEHAIAVFSARHFQIGYIASQRAVYLGKLLRDGHELNPVFQDLAPWGCIVRIGVDIPAVLPAPGEDADERDDTGADEIYQDFDADPIPPDEWL